MVACKNCVCLVGLRLVVYRWIAGGWIYSKPVGWLFFCWDRSFGRIYGRWLACRLVCLLSSLSVGWAIRPACYIQPITVWPANHPSIYHSIWSLTNRPKTVLLSALASNQCLNFLNLGFDVSPFLLGWLAAVGLPDPCSQVAGQFWSVFHLASQGGIPSLLDRLSSDRSRNAQKGVCGLLCHAMYIYFLMLRIQLQVLPIPPILVMGWNKFLVTPP